MVRAEFCPRVRVPVSLWSRTVPSAAKAVPPGYALTADAGAPAEAPPPAQALAVDKQPGAAKAESHRPPYRSIGAAAVIHLALLVSLIVHPGPAKELGMEHGLPEALNVSIISSADLKRLSSDPTERDTPPPAPAPTPEIPAPPQPEPQPPVPPQTAEQLAMAENPPRRNLRRASRARRPTTPRSSSKWPRANFPRNSIMPLRRSNSGS